MFKKISYFLIGLFVIIVLFQNQFYRLKPKQNLENKYIQELEHLGKEALESNDVPVAVIITYNDSIIGVGYNTVNKDSILSGHAEINLRFKCLKTTGINFMI